MSPVDEKAQALWDNYTKYKQAMFDKTNTEHAPWIIIDANIKPLARLKAIDHIFESIPFK